MSQKIGDTIQNMQKSDQCNPGVMKWFGKGAAAVLLLFGLTGCVSTPMTIAGLEFVNATDKPISNVELRVMGTYEVASCSYILARTKFSTKFPLLEYRGHEIRVSWSNRQGIHHFGPEVISTPSEIPEHPVMVVITFTPRGETFVSFR